MYESPKLYSAIVIRSFFPTKHKLRLFSDELGSHEVVFNKPLALMQGGLIEYRLRTQGNISFLTHMQLIGEMHRWVTTDIYFLHVVLELTYFFVPLQSSPQSLYTHFMLLYEEPLIEDSIVYKKLFLCRLFSLLGIYPEHPEQFDAKFLCLISAPINIMLNMHHVDFLEMIDAWIFGCIHSHPLHKEIKTDFNKCGLL